MSKRSEKAAWEGILESFVLEAESLEKSFSGVKALKNGSVRLRAGAVHALCGGNGAGKSTFLSIVMGIQKRDAGKILFKGEAVEFDNPADALDAGICIIEQELSPIPAMTVAENIFLGREPITSFGSIRFREMNASAQRLLDMLHFDIRATELMMDLPVAKLQLVEIAKALSYDAQVVIMDEPTSALGEHEADKLFEAIERLKEQGKAIVYVSHRLTEIFRICDDYTVFRDGEAVGQGSIADIDKDALIQMIVGRPLTEEFVKENAPRDKVALEVDGLNTAGFVKDINFKAHAGEILAFYGLMGSGRTEIFEALFGLNRSEAKITRLLDRDLVSISPRDAIERGLAFVTEDRKSSGLVLSADVRSNLCLATLDKLSRGPVMRTAEERRSAQGMIDLFSIKTPNDRLEVSGLSGGNQQKVVLGKWFLTKPDVLMLDEPTRGVDVGAKREIYKVMSDFAQDGGAVLMVSSEVDEVVGMADRVIVMRNGKIAGELQREEITAEKLVSLAA